MIHQGSCSADKQGLEHQEVESDPLHLIIFTKQELKKNNPRDQMNNLWGIHSLLLNIVKLPLNI